MNLKRKFIIYMDHLEDKKLEKAMFYDDLDIQENIITKGLKKELWNDLLSKCNYYGAKVAGYSNEDIIKIVNNDNLSFSVDKAFYTYLFFIFLYPIELLYKFICDLFIPK